MTITKFTHTRQLGRVLAVGLLCLSPVLLASCGKTKTTDKTNVDSRIVELESKESIRSTWLDFNKAADSGDPAELASLGPVLDSQFTRDMTDFQGTPHHFEGAQGLVQGYGALMAAMDADIVPGSIDVNLDVDSATAQFKTISSVKPSPELGLQPDERVLVICNHTATFMRADGRWRLRSIKTYSALAYPGTL